MFPIAGSCRRTLPRETDFFARFATGNRPCNCLASESTSPRRPASFSGNPTEVVIAQTDQGRGIPGVVDGASPKGAETGPDVDWRKVFRGRSGTSSERSRSPAGTATRCPGPIRLPFARDELIGV